MRELKIFKKYRHFKGGECFVLCKSIPLERKEFLKRVKMMYFECMHTETYNNIKIFKSLDDEMYYHDSRWSEDVLVVYGALYDNFGRYTRPYNMFMSEVDKEKYPNAKQKYRLEEID